MKTYKQNSKYKIIIEEAKEECYDVYRFRDGHGRFTLVGSSIWFILQERYWFFGWHWKNVGWTNMATEARKWEEYFK